MVCEKCSKRTTGLIHATTL
ncbi:hypothetical protein KIPB_003503, partial [Kipferlia bialata]|eukprot:g3503.t1